MSHASQSPVSSTPVPARARSTTASPTGIGNRLLAALGVLSPDDAAWLLPRLERASFRSGDMLAAAGGRLEHVYFPDSAVVSVVSRMSDGSSVEVGTVGNEGLVSVSAFLGNGSGIHDTLVQVPGDARRAPAADIVAAAEERPLLRKLIGRYAQAYLTQVGQTAACNRLHHLEARCARWLLMTHDRVDGADRFELTQEFLATMLGVRRAGVSVAAAGLRSAGIIRYSRGAVRVLDRQGLEHASCECYGIVRREFDRLLP